MRATLRILTITAILAAASVATAAPAAASAACHHVHQQTGNNYGILNGTQVYAPIDLGLNVTGNALALLGYANATSTHTTTVTCHR